ncbi:MAG TPA: ABC transporter permease [Atribacteraceae bacterium]|nr:ABC transporter permease [Atribacteraceae bacterium]
MTANSNFIKKFLWAQSTGVLVMLIVLFILFGFYSEYRFFMPANLRSLLAFGAEFSLIFLAVGVLMIAGEFDLSIGSLLVFASYIFIQLLQVGINPFLVFLIILGICALMGLLNALITVKGQIPSFVATLGMMMFWRGFTLLLSGGATESIDLTGHPLFVSFMTGSIAGFFPVQFIWFGAVALLLGVLLHWQRFGNWIFATGDNRDAARAMGINTDYVKIMCFVMVGILCACSAGMQLTRVSTFSSRVGEGWELRAVAAAVVGGTSLRGGMGSMSGIFLGAMTIMTIDNGLVAMRIPHQWSFVVFGLVILFSVLASMYLEKKRLSHR